MLNNGERQVAPDVTGIRRDHVARYEFALRQLSPNSKVLDLACGVGYGTDILAAAGHRVTGVDNSAEAIDYAHAHYAGNGAKFICANAEEIDIADFDAVVCFETIEHIADPAPLLRKFWEASVRLIASVPNEEVFPYRNYAFHHRHYTRAEFRDLLTDNGWQPVTWWGQEGPHSEVESEKNGRTVIMVSKRMDAMPAAMARPETVPAPAVAVPEKVPEHVAIVGLGPSSSAYLELVKRLGNRHVFSDEVWAINAIGDVINCDRVFHMDDLWIQEQRAKSKPDSNIAHMVEWLRRFPGPVYTSRIRPGYPGLVEYPLADVIGQGGFAYFNSTAAYAIAYAVHIGVKQLSLFGLDYTLPNVHSGEQGRACCEFWLGIGAARGMTINVPEQTSLMDGCVSDDQKLYGYDCVNVKVIGDDEGCKVEFSPRAKLPTAAEIEKRYDHGRHTNHLLRR